MIKVINKIQTLYRINKINACFLYLDLNNLDLLVLNNLQLWMLNSVNKSVFLELINYIIYDKSIDSKGVKQILSAYIILYHSKEIFNSNEENNIVEQTILNLSKNLEKYMNLFCKACQEKNIFLFNLYRFKINKYVKEYLDYFPLWERVDKLFLLKYLYELYFDYEELVKRESKLKNEIQIQQNQIISQIKILSKNDFQIKKQMNELYWDIMSEELKNKKYTKLLSTLKDIKNLLCALVPSRIDIHNEIYEILDIEFICQMLNSDDIDTKYIYKLINYLLEKLYEFQSKSDDESFLKWKKQLIDDFEKGEMFYIYLPSFLKIYINRLRMVYEKSNKFKAMIFKDKNIN